MSASGTEGVGSETVRSEGMNWNSVESFGRLNPVWDAGSASLSLSEMSGPRHRSVTVQGPPPPRSGASNEIPAD